jgi:hypothetical protein
MPTYPTYPTCSLESFSNKGSDACREACREPTSLPTYDQVQKHAQNGVYVGNVGNVGKTPNSNIIDENSSQVSPIALVSPSVSGTDTKSERSPITIMYDNKSLEELEKEAVMIQGMTALEQAGFVMRDPLRDKGYFDRSDFVTRLTLLPNTKWTEDEAEQTLMQLLHEGIIEEIEPGRYKPAAAVVVDAQEFDQP